MDRHRRNAQLNLIKCKRTECYAAEANFGNDNSDTNLINALRSLVFNENPYDEFNPNAGMEHIFPDHATGETVQYEFNPNAGMEHIFPDHATGETVQYEFNPNVGMEHIFPDHSTDETGQDNQNLFSDWEKLALSCQKIASNTMREAIHEFSRII